MGTHLSFRAIGIASFLCVFLAHNASGWQSSGGSQQQPQCLGIGCSAGSAQPVPSPTPSTKKQDNAEPQPISIPRVFLNLPGDQKAIWTSPLRLRGTDLFWVAPLAATSGVLIGSDQHSMERERSNADAISLSKDISNGGLIGMAALPASMYVWGSLHAAPRARETGLLSAEAMIDSLGVNEAMKVVFGRERPTATDGQGRFFQTFGLNGSFPSVHATLSWTAASLIAHEYPGWLSQALVYGAATTVSISRVTARQHFPADVVVGSALGWLIGREIYNRHHDTDLDDASYGTFSRLPGEALNPDSLGSRFEPLDSWVYPELKRLAALGYIRTQFTGLMPWTRTECLRQVEEAEYYAQDLPPDSSVKRSIERLKQEFSNDGQHYYIAQVDSVYSHYTQISGTPLRDSYHFGQTLWNDFGRPYDEGANLITGASASAVAGRFFFYAQGEYQHAPGRGPLSDAQRQAIATADENPVLQPAPIATIDRFYLIDLYAGVKLGQYAMTFGKQSQWLGPSETGPLMLSDNADPMYSLSLSRTTPLVLPGFLHWLGQIRGEILFGKLSGHQFPQRPFYNLQKISFHLTENLEVGFTRASLWAGVGHPFTAHALARNFGSFNDVSVFTPSSFGDRNDPGDRMSGFDFSYRVPGLRKWLTLYSDMYSDDDPSPLANPRRSAVNPGVYISHFPGLANLDFRAEAASTQMLISQDLGPTFLYFNNQYHDANTNKGNLFGSSIGRDAKAYQGWSTYHFSATSKLVLNFRQLKASNLFLPGGGTQTDARATFSWEARPGVMISTFVQDERWLIPILRPTAQHDLTGQIELRYTPHWQVQHD
ncbi:MAG TPA: capsule assembly Wzi family protein [Candidatus Acidoferrales bacterium]|nr:capsule assembly Wzi family protein [Candidatus Acidoferrales bacterium]